MSIEHDNNWQPQLDPNRNSDDTPLHSQEDHQNSSHDLRLVIHFMAVHFLLSFCELILVAPLIKLFEQSLCISYYGHHDPGVIGPGGNVPEVLCKIGAVQAPLAAIRGWKSMFDTIPVLVVAIPFGKLADRYGRRKLMAICLLGVACSFGEIFVVCAFPLVIPLQLVWLSSGILLCGGGCYSAAALMWAMAAESFPEERRSQAFYYISAAFYAGELVSSFTAAATMDISPWISCFLSMAAIFACLVLIRITPESQKLTKKAALGGRQASTPESNENSLLISRELPVKDLDILGLLSSKNILLAIPIFLVGSVRFTILNILIQYSSIRFALKISTGALFYTETAVVNTFLFLFAIPSLSTYIRSMHTNVRAQTIDLFISRSCVCLLSFGSLIIGLSPSNEFLPIGVLIYSAGFGSRVSTLSLISYWIPDGSRAMIYAAIAVIENVGHAIGDPALQLAFAATLRLQLGSYWQALPFYIAAGLYCLAGLLAGFIDIEETSHN